MALQSQSACTRRRSLRGILCEKIPMTNCELCSNSSDVHSNLPIAAAHQPAAERKKTIFFLSVRPPLPPFTVSSSAKYLVAITIKLIFLFICFSFSFICCRFICRLLVRSGRASNNEPAVHESRGGSPSVTVPLILKRRLKNTLLPNNSQLVEKVRARYRKSPSRAGEPESAQSRARTAKTRRRK